MCVCVCVFVGVWVGVGGCVWVWVWGVCGCTHYNNDIVCAALNDSCLVFDNRLVISTDHSTNDPHILAAGPLTKYSRQYRADNW